jgi:hypothetical protein
MKPFDFGTGLLKSVGSTHFHASRENTEVLHFAEVSRPGGVLFPLRKKVWLPHCAPVPKSPARARERTLTGHERYHRTRSLGSSPRLLPLFPMRIVRHPDRGSAYGSKNEPLATSGGPYHPHDAGAEGDGQGFPGAVDQRRVWIGRRGLQ